MTEEKKKTSKTAWGCLTIIILFFVLMYFMYDALLSTKFKENTKKLIEGVLLLLNLVRSIFGFSLEAF